MILAASNLEPAATWWLEFMKGIGTPGAAIVAGLFAAWQFLRQRRIEVQKPFLQKQLDLYNDTISVVGQLYTLNPDSTEWKEADNRFWRLYWAGMPMVEHDDVEDRMVKFGDELKAYKREPSWKGRNRLRYRSFNLAHAIRSAIERTWRTDQQAPPRLVDSEWIRQGHEPDSPFLDPGDEELQPTGSESEKASPMVRSSE
jgi:hypothetical protein